MSANGALAGENLIEYAAVDETGWSALMPAALAAGASPGVFARSIAGGSIAAPVVYAADFGGMEWVSLAALWFTNLGQTDRVRVLFYGRLGRAAAPTADLGWRRVMPALFAGRNIRWGAPNLFSGGLAPRDWRLYPHNFIATFPRIRASAVVFLIASTGRAADPLDPRRSVLAGHVDIGCAWASEMLAFERNFSKGLADTYTPGSEIRRMPGGDVVDFAPGRRSVLIPFGAIRRNQSDALWDLVNRVGFDRPIAWIPDLRDPARMARYGFLGGVRAPTSVNRRYFRHDELSIKLEELA